VGIDKAGANCHAFSVYNSCGVRIADIAAYASNFSFHNPDMSRIAWVSRTVDDTAIAYHQVQFSHHFFLPSPKLSKVAIEI
jgi:hypothetical protein